MKPTLRNGISITTIALACAVALAPATVLAARNGSNGTTLAASKTVDVCTLPDGRWQYSGVLSVWNEGVLNTEGLAINDVIEYKVDNKPWKSICTALNISSTSGIFIPAGTTLQTATTFAYSCTADPVAGTVRNNAKLTILNHSGSLGKATGPNPKATWTGELLPCQPEGCTRTQGYWGNKPGVVWPEGFDRNASFFNSGLTWQQLLDMSAGGNGYVILAKQYIPAVLNEASGAPVPSGVESVIASAEAFFGANATPSAACPLNSSCGTQKTWGGILDTYNNGVYPGGPAHCAD